ncbi:hypothetical protein MHK71_10800 [Kocuria indica]|uniref:hypothetical protein n=1 Tax=Kocuria marina TaxID=223184 RepID=UPI001EF552BC|nr:hypothetical protein [Kocuria indica]MCG7432967.1 hypothetical protein [Kocuria indica]
MVTHWNRTPNSRTVPLIVLTALLGVAAIVVHFLGQNDPALNATGGLRNILWFATFVAAFVTYFTARRGRRR